ncbi:sugar ABC transporter permease [Eisenbergiella tayi]|uniref:L-arabinose transport system permease protein AraQ n=1 Tax=Eisenbergiella tayi TaxID=1432052 RepID=A0A1E3APC8_9FIRM|nr:carbohydrate ABC transporter permease [Eisenbergiella tayi]ODM10605.1 L-arabinose transport system permease protein AraQ [Eisenbergiella tayi]OIZ61905.1 sugar ABC transporter permease [Eisenbergiella tayi]
MKTKKNVKNVVKYTVLIIWTFVSLFPLYYMLMFSLKDNSEIFGSNVIGLPKHWLWSNYKKALIAGNMGLYFFNSCVVTGLTILFTILFSLMAAYALERMIWKGRKQINALFMLGLTVPIHAAILPIFIILRKFHMLNSYQSLIVPYVAFALAMAIMICSSFVISIPVELEESACIDGAGIYKIFWVIICPLMKPAFASVAIFTFLQAWNELMFAIIYISDSKYRTLSVGIQSLSGAYTTDWGPIGAGLVIATFPTLIIYLFMSKKIQSSLMAGAIKG